MSKQKSESKILTIIVPTYNMELYLDKCLASLIPQNEERDVEVIVVNDGSTDSSLSIAHKYKEEYPDIFIVIDKENGNYGSCINTALPLARGKYVKILDADDYFDNEKFHLYIEFLRNVDVDIIVNDFLIVNSSGIVTHREVFNLETPFSIDDLQNVDMWMHAVAYKTDNLRSINYSQSEGISYTDQEWVFTPMINVKTGARFPYFLYMYLNGREGQTISNSSYKKNLWMEIQGLRKMIIVYETIKDDVNKAVRKYLIHRIMSRTKFIYMTALVTTFTPRSENLKRLSVLDDYYKDFSPELYMLSNDITFDIKPMYNIHFIQCWRKHKNAYSLPLIIKRLFV